MISIGELEASESFEELVENLGKALGDKSVFKWEFPEDFHALYASLIRLASEDDHIRVVSFLGRVEALIKKPVFDLKAAKILVLSAPELAMLKDGDERYYAVLFCQRLSPQWLYEWAVINAWSESSAEKVRLVLVEVIVEIAADFEAVLENLGAAGLAYAKDNTMNEPKITTRFLRVLKSVRSVCQATDIICDLGVGKAIDKFVGAPFSHLNANETKLNARENLVPEVVGLLLDLVGQRFSLAIEAEHYIALKRARRWCDDSGWRSVADKHAVMDKLSNTIAEAVLILARQNITDGELLKRLKESVVGEQNYLLLCQQIADRGHLEDSVARWLRSGGDRQHDKKTISSETTLATKGESADVGELLQRLQEGQSTVNVLETAIDDLELFDPTLVPRVQDIANHWDIVSQIAEKLAKRHSVKLLGVPGEILDIDRKLFDVADETNVSQRKGTVVRSAIITSLDGKTRVIKKGVVRAKE